MSDQFFYLELEFTPKVGTGVSRITGKQQMAVEVPKDLVRSKQAGLLNENLTENAITNR
jgi:hypothetical protein